MKRNSVLDYEPMKGYGLVYRYYDSNNKSYVGSTKTTIRTNGKFKG